MTFPDVDCVTTKPLKPCRGARVRLLHDVSTRGGRKFRAGVVMWVLDTDRGWHLAVTVRAKTHYLTLKKRDYPRAFVVVSVPQTKDDVQ